MYHVPVVVLFFLPAAVLAGAPPFSWAHVPVFFHSMNASGPWSDAAVAAIARYPLATFEKAMASAGQPGHSEAAGPAACRQVGSVSPSMWTFYYLNSVVDWEFYTLHDAMVSHPSWRLKDKTGKDIRVAKQWAYNLSVPALQSRWIDDCVAATEAGCSGCFIDRSNNASQYNHSTPMTPNDSRMYQLAHMATLTALNEKLGADKMAINNNQGKLAGQRAMMLEDFAAQEECIYALQEIGKRGVIVEAHAGDFTDGSDQKCKEVTNSLATFLIGAEQGAYYNCAAEWSSNPKWPEERDAWLDWKPEFSEPLGAPLGAGVKTNGIWQRHFASGARVTFDATQRNGTIVWGSGRVQAGAPLSSSASASSAGGPTRGCNWWKAT